MAKKATRQRGVTHIPSQEMRAKVRLYVVAKFSQERIADLLGIDPKTLRKHYRRELDVAMDELKARIIGKNIEMAMDGHPTMLIWVTKNICEWSDAQTVKHTGDSVPSTRIGFDISFANGGPGAMGVEMSPDIAPHGAATQAGNSPA